MGCDAQSAAYLAFPYLLSHMVSLEHLYRYPGVPVYNLKTTGFKF